MNGMRGWRSQKNALSANATSSHHANQNPAIMLARVKRGGEYEVARRKGGRKTMMNHDAEDNGEGEKRKEIDKERA